MNTQELETKYADLYRMMASSNKVENMMLFGKVMNEMMHYTIKYHPSEAQAWIDTLDAIAWKNYLTPDEAERIISNMSPCAPWTRDEWNKAMDSCGLSKEERPYYNKCALYTVMCMVYSDHGNTIADMMGIPIDDVPLEVYYKFAQNFLRDADAVYNVRTYFNV